MYNFAFEVFIGVGDDADDYTLIRCIMQENVRRNNKKRERHQNPASSSKNLSGGNYHHLPVLDIVLKNIKNQYSGAKPLGACSLGIAGIRALSEGNYHHLPVLDIVLKNIKNQYLWRCVVWHMPFMHRGTYQI